MKAMIRIAVALVAAVNYFGVRTAGRIQILLTGLKVGALLALIGVGLLVKNDGEAHTSISEIQAGFGGMGAFLSALVPIMMAYNGFQYLGQIGGEIVNPQKNIPRAAIFAVLVVVTLFVLTNLVYFRVLDVSSIAHSQHVASDAAEKIAGSSGARWLTILMMISALGSLHVNFLARPRVLYAMACDGRFFNFAKHVQPTFHTPSAAILFHGLIATLLVLTGSFEEIYSLVIFSVWIFLALTAAAVIRLRKSEAGLTRPYRAFGYPWTPLIVVFAASAICVNLWLDRPVRSSIGLAIILLGIPFFRVLQKRAVGSTLVKATPSVRV